MSNENKERIYYTNVWYENCDDTAPDVFVTLTDCYTLIRDIYDNYWKFDEYSSQGKDFIIQALKNTDVDERLIRFLEFLDEDEVVGFASDGNPYDLCWRVLEDCGQIIPTSQTRSVYY